MTEPTARDVLAEEALCRRADAAAELYEAILAYLNPDNQFTHSRQHAMEEAERRLRAALSPQPEAAGEAGLREALATFFEDIDADWTNDNTRPATLAFRFSAAAERLRVLAAPALPEPER